MVGGGGRLGARKPTSDCVLLSSVLQTPVEEQEKNVFIELPLTEARPHTYSSLSHTHILSLSSFLFTSLQAEVLWTELRARVPRSVYRPGSGISKQLAIHLASVTAQLSRAVIGSGVRCNKVFTHFTLCLHTHTHTQTLTKICTHTLSVEDSIILWSSARACLRL